MPPPLAKAVAAAIVVMLVQALHSVRVGREGAPRDSGVAAVSSSRAG
jgi:hypothetical protein